MNQKQKNLDPAEYARQMRSALSNDHIRKNDGSINHQYFLVKKGQYWSNDMNIQLFKHLENDGVGNWKHMIRNQLELTTEIELELRTCLLFKISDLTDYMGKKYTKDQIEKIGNENIARAQSLNKLKYGIYVFSKKVCSQLLQFILIDCFQNQYIIFSQQKNQKRKKCKCSSDLNHILGIKRLRIRKITTDKSLEVPSLTNVVQNVKLNPNFQNIKNYSQIPENSLQQKLADSSAVIKKLETQLAELQKQNESLDTRLKKANNMVAEYWIRVKDAEKNSDAYQQRLQQFVLKYKNAREKKKMFKRRIIDALNYFYGRYVDAQQQNAPFLQLEEMRQVLLSLGMHESIFQEMQQLNAQIQNNQAPHVDNMSYEQLLALQEQIGNQNVGFTEQQIKQLPKDVVQEEKHEICTICYENFEIGHKYRTLPCNHLYHSKCIKAWLCNHKKCPLCNIEVLI
ncbi:hypothetical protein pb186bvf_001210 [Paramecium bursaria]